MPSHLEIIQTVSNPGYAATLPKATISIGGPPGFYVTVNLSAAKSKLKSFLAQQFPYFLANPDLYSNMTDYAHSVPGWVQGRPAYYESYYSPNVTLMRYRDDWGWTVSYTTSYAGWTAYLKLTEAEEKKVKAQADILRRTYADEQNAIRAAEEAAAAELNPEYVPYSPPVPTLIGTTGEPTANTGFGTVEAPALLAGTPQYYAFYTVYDGTNSDEANAAAAVAAETGYIPPEPDPPEGYEPPYVNPMVDYEPPPYPSEALVYKKWSERSRGWFTEVIEELPNCYLTFTFGKPTKVMAISMATVTYREKEIKPIDQDMVDALGPDDFCPIIEANLETTTLVDEVYFIGNFEVLASNDEENWTTLFTGSNTDELSRYVFLNNTGYFSYYRINILNNDSLDEDIFNKNYYGIGQLKFYSYEYAEGKGPDPIALYDFAEPDDPKIVKINNAEVIESTEVIDVGYDTEYKVAGIGFYTVISGSLGNPLGYYHVNLHGVLDTIVYGGFLSNTASGVGTSDDVFMYVPPDEVGRLGSGTAETSDGHSFMTTAVNQSFEMPIDTVDWTGTATVTYDAVASGTLVSGTSYYYSLVGTVTRTYAASLTPRGNEYRLTVDEFTTNSGVVASGTELYMWGYSNTARPLDMDVMNSISVEVITGEAYNCRLTAWDDVTHSTTYNELIQGEHTRVSAIAFIGTGDKLEPDESKDPLNLVYPPVHNRILKGHTVVDDYKYYYGDFDMTYSHEPGTCGAFLMFKPMLYGIDSNISYDVHDHIVTLHYSYT